MGTSRRVLRLLVCLALVGAVLFPVGASAVELIGPSSGDRGQELRARYRIAQADPHLGDEARIKSAVETYFLLKYESQVLGKVLDIESVVDRSTPSGEALYDYEQTRLSYFLQCWELGDCDFTSYRFHPEYGSLDIGSSTATAVVRPEVELTMAHADEQSPLGQEEHTVTLVNTPQGWKVIEDAYENEWTLGYPPGTDFVTLEQTLVERWNAKQALWGEWLRERAADPRFMGRFRSKRETDIDSGITGYLNYSRSKVTYYGNKYTDASGSYSTEKYNKLFDDFVDSGGDCQNFVSQCIWYGFGGQNNSDAIQNRRLPMIYNVPGATCWWCTLYGCDGGAPGPWHWANVGHFRNMVLDNTEHNKVGVHALEGLVEGVLIGDYVATGSWNHVYVVVNVIDYDGDFRTDYNEIYISAHTLNRKNSLLQIWEPDCDNVHLMWVLGFVTL